METPDPRNERRKDELLEEMSAGPGESKPQDPNSPGGSREEGPSQKDLTH